MKTTRIKTIIPPCDLEHAGKGQRKQFVLKWPMARPLQAYHLGQKVKVIILTSLGVLKPNPTDLMNLCCLAFNVLPITLFLFWKIGACF